MYKSDKEDLIILAAVVIVLAIIAGLGCAFSYGRCMHLEELHGDKFNFNWSLYTACLVEIPNGKWVDSDEFLQYYGDLHTLQIGDVGE